MRSTPWLKPSPHRPRTASVVSPILIPSVIASAAKDQALAVTGELCKNVLLADVPAIIGSIDIVMGEVDRAIREEELRVGGLRLVRVVGSGRGHDADIKAELAG